MCDMKCLVAANGKPAPFWTEEEQRWEQTGGGVREQEERQEEKLWLVCKVNKKRN